MHQNENVWFPKVIKTSVYNKTGFEELIDVIFDRYDFLNKNGYIDKKHQSRYIKQVKSLVSKYLDSAFWDKSKEKVLSDELKIKIKDRNNPVILAKKLIDESR